MEDLRSEKNRKGEPPNNSTARKNKNQAPVEFEGMNYELKRKPYKEDTREEEKNVSNDKLPRRRDQP